VRDRRTAHVIFISGASVDEEEEEDAEPGSDEGDPDAEAEADGSPPRRHRFSRKRKAADDASDPEAAE